MSKIAELGNYATRILENLEKRFPHIPPPTYVKFTRSRIEFSWMHPRGYICVEACVVRDSAKVFFMEESTPEEEYAYRFDFPLSDLLP